MPNWIRQFFKNKQTVAPQPETAPEYKLISTNWNAHPVNPEVRLTETDQGLCLTCFVNSIQYEQFSSNDRVQLHFKSCSQYAFTPCNDEGYFLGQYRIKPDELPWGECYELLAGFDRKLPSPVRYLNTTEAANKHFIFFF